MPTREAIERVVERVRRTPLGALGEPDPAALERASLLAAAELTWDDERRRQEIAAMREFYRR